jgi:hypothetical protein
MQNRGKLNLGETGVSVLRTFSSQSSRSKVGTSDFTFNNLGRSPPAVFTKLHLCVLLLQKGTPANVISYSVIAYSVIAYNVIAHSVIAYNVIA